MTLLARRKRRTCLGSTLFGTEMHLCPYEMQSGRLVFVDVTGGGGRDGAKASSPMLTPQVLVLEEFQGTAQGVPHGKV